MTDHTAREAAIQAVKDHPSTTFMAPYESLADAVLTSATPLLRAETLREEAANLRRVEREDTPEGALGTRTGLLRAALILDERIDEQAGRPVHPRRADAAKEHQAARDDNPTGQKYPCGLGIFCDTCGTEFRGDFIVTDTMTKAERLEIIRNHVRTKLGWQSNDTGDNCPTCRTDPAAAAIRDEALHQAAHRIRDLTSSKFTDLGKQTLLEAADLIDPKTTE